jgi:hypothetical protein
MTTVEGECLLCGETAEPTVEHILPQTLLIQLGMDPNREDLQTFRTMLCRRHNHATSGLHSRDEMIKLMVNGGPVTRRTLRHLGDWAVWVMSLLSLARGSGVIDPNIARAALLRRFDSVEGGTPRGVRVYAARATAFRISPEPPVVPHALALVGDTSVCLTTPAIRSGSACQPDPSLLLIQLGSERSPFSSLRETYSSGPDHNNRLDAAVRKVCLDRILPLPDRVPELTPTAISMRAVSKLFTVLPFGADLSLMPEGIRPPITEEGTAPDNSI